MRAFRYILADPPVKGPRLTVRGIGFREPMRPGLVNRPAGTGDHLLMFFYERCRVGIDASAAWHRPTTLIIWSRGQSHYYGNDQQPWRHSWIHCDGTLVRQAIGDARLRMDKPMQLSDPGLVEHHLLGMHHELSEHAQPDAGILGNLLRNFLLDVARHVRRRATPSVPDALLQLKRHLEIEFDQPTRLNELATRVGLTPQHLCSAFKRWFGVPPMDYLIQLRLHHAAHLLRDQNMSVTDVARRVGYDNLFHFSKLFTRRYGINPSKLRPTARRASVQRRIAAR